MFKTILFLILLSSSCFASEWECDDNKWGGYNICRIGVPHGWLITNDTNRGGMAFYPDEKHEWKLQ